MFSSIRMVHSLFVFMMGRLDRINILLRRFYFTDYGVFKTFLAEIRRVDFLSDR